MRQVVAEVEQPVDAVAPQHVRDLVRVGDDGGRPERQHESREFVGKQLCRLEMHVRVDEARHHVATRRVDDLRAVVLAEAGDVAAGDRHVGLQPLAREHREHAPAPEHEVGGLVPAGNRESAGEVGHRSTINRITLPRMDVLTPRSLDEALRLRAEVPGARPIEGGTDLMVDLNFDRTRPDALLNLNEVDDLKGWSREKGALRLGAGLTYAEAMSVELAALLPALAEASRTVGSPQIRNRGTIGGNLGTSSPAGDALPPLLIEHAEVECASLRGVRTLPLAEFITGVKSNVLAADELITAVHLIPSAAPQTSMK